MPSYPPQAESYADQQARLAALASTQAASAWVSGDSASLARAVSTIQYAAAVEADPYLSEFAPAPAGRVNPVAFAGVTGAGWSLLDLFELAESQPALQRMAATAVQDAGRGSVAAGMAARPQITGYVRVLTTPSCSRCAVIAGRWYRWNEGFQRH